MSSISLFSRSPLKNAENFESNFLILSSTSEISVNSRFLLSWNILFKELDFFCFRCWWMCCNCSSFIARPTVNVDRIEIHSLSRLSIRKRNSGISAICVSTCLKTCLMLASVSPFISQRTWKNKINRLTYYLSLILRR